MSLFSFPNKTFTYISTKTPPWEATAWVTEQYLCRAFCSVYSWPGGDITLRVMMWHSLGTAIRGWVPNSGAPVSTPEMQRPFISQSPGRRDIWGFESLPNLFHVRCSQWQSLLPRQRTQCAAIPPPILLKPQSNILNSTWRPLPSGWQSHPGQANPANIRLKQEREPGLAWKAHRSLLPRWLLHLCPWWGD